MIIRRVTRRYDSFVIRCWALDGAEPRIEVEHIQSGRRVHLSSLASAVAWMSSTPSETTSQEESTAGK